MLLLHHLHLLFLLLLCRQLRHFVFGHGFKLLFFFVAEHALIYEILLGQRERFFLKLLLRKQNHFGLHFFVMLVAEFCRFFAEEIRGDSRLLRHNIGYLVGLLLSLGH